MFSGRGKLLSIFIGESDQHDHEALYLALLEMLRREGCSGATAIKGTAGYGISSLIHTSTIPRLSLDQPIVIIAVDRPDRMDRLVGKVRELAPKALVTLQDVDVLQSGASFEQGAGLKNESK
ncbi:MAG: DUF190 domain-containing protein [Candidatus Binataceae bacterium]